MKNLFNSNKKYNLSETSRNLIIQFFIELSVYLENKRLFEIFDMRSQRFSATDEEIESFVCKQDIEE